MDTIILSNITEERWREIMRDTFREELKLLPSKESTSYKTAYEACQLLHITKPTLNEYVRRGFIKGKRLGRRILFEEADIQVAVKEIPNLRYNREVRRAK